MILAIVTFVWRNPLRRIRLEELWVVTVGEGASSVVLADGSVLVYSPVEGGELLWVDTEGLIARRVAASGRALQALDPAGAVLADDVAIYLLSAGGNESRMAPVAVPEHVFFAGGQLILAASRPGPQGTLGDRVEILAAGKRWVVEAEHDLVIGVTSIDDALVLTALRTDVPTVATAMRMLVDGETLWEVELGDRLSSGPIAVPGGVAVAAGRVLSCYDRSGTRRWELGTRGDVQLLADTGAALVAVTTTPASWIGREETGVVYVDYHGKTVWYTKIAGAVEQIEATPDTIAVLQNGELWLIETSRGRAGRTGLEGLSWVGLDESGRRVVVLTQTGVLMSYRILK
jgi:hypothetical protein